MGHMIDRTHRDFSEEDTFKIVNTYSQWRSKEGAYEDIQGFCKSADIKEIEKHQFVLTPGRYVGIPDEEDDGIPFEEKMEKLVGELKEQMKEEERLNKEIEAQLKKIG